MISRVGMSLGIREPANAQQEQGQVGQVAVAECNNRLIVFMNLVCLDNTWTVVPQETQLTAF